MTDRDGDSDFWSRLNREELPHCGQCDRTRHVEGDGGRLTRCPTCHPLAGEPMPQTRRRPGEPDPPARTERYAEAAAEARRMLADRPRPLTDPGAPDTPRLYGEALAREQLAEARAARLEPTADPPDGQPPGGDDYPF
jgi:hypothetical protein